ncbi:SPL family radical SAM protein [Paenibacillus sp.]|uniref:SPL family radical SAM protein n=1 Tax=Paenibacillus sp. TaxID=58172 RepID=UPI002D4BF059|nr:radical SAM protein [Paenibacillus sp.]HZG54983.1 radical SAM protein [Paenibacillus sp.]
MAGKTYETMNAKLVLNRVKAERMPFDWSLNPYRGCAHGCSFCYARAFQPFIGKEPTDEFQNHIILKTNAAEALEAQLSGIARRSCIRPEDVGNLLGPVAVGTATDPYQPIEAKTLLTKSCLRVLAKYRVPTSVTTRSPLVLRDIAELRELELTSINISINTLDAVTTRRMEPATPHPLQRLRTVEKLAAAGLPVGVFVAPILPYLTDAEDQLDDLFGAAKSHGAAFAMTSLLRLSADVKTWYFRTLEECYPELPALYARLYEGAYVHPRYGEVIRERIGRVSRRHGLTGNIPARPQAPASDKVDMPAKPEQLAFSF